LRVPRSLLGLGDFPVGVFARVGHLLIGQLRRGFGLLLRLVKSAQPVEGIRRRDLAAMQKALADLEEYQRQVPTTDDRTLPIVERPQVSLMQCARSQKEVQRLNIQALITEKKLGKP
jgi:hypothetical protein